MKACEQGYARLEKFSSLVNFHNPMIMTNNHDKIVRKLLCAPKSFANVICKMHVMH